MDQEKGLLGVFKDTQALTEAVKRVRNLGIEKFDAFTPYPVHGLEHAMGLKRSWIPWATLVFALTGTAGGLFLQYWTGAVDWPLNVGGKPFFSWPAFIPVTFETTILLGGVLTVLTLLAVMKIPQFSKDVLHPALTDDRFGLYVDETDRRFDAAKLSQVFKECHAEEIKKIG